MTTLVDFYKSLLTSAQLTFTEDDAIVMASDTETPLTASKMPVFLPTKKVLNKKGDDFVIYHPLSEDILSRSESIVHVRTRKLLSAHINMLFNTLTLMCLELAEDVKGHKALSPKQINVISRLPKVSKKHIEAFTELMSNKLDGKVVDLYVKVNGEHGDDVFNRLCVASFAFKDEFLDTTNKTVCGYDLKSLECKRILATAIDIVLPKANTIGGYTTGSDDPTAPYYHSVLTTYAKIYMDLHNIAKRFGKFAQKYLNDTLGYDYVWNLDWIESLDDFHKLLRDVPPQKHNARSPKKETEVKALPKSRNALAYDNINAAPSEPQQTHSQQAPAVSEDGIKTLSVNEALNARYNQNPQMQQPHYGNNGYGGYQQPHQFQQYHQPQYPQHQFGQPIGFNNNVGFGGNNGGFGSTGGFVNSFSNQGNGFTNQPMNSGFGNESKTVSLDAVLGNLNQRRFNSW